MSPKRFVLAAAVLALVLPFAGGCRHRCCKSNSVSQAPPGCCPTLPPGSLPPPANF